MTIKTSELAQDRPTYFPAVIRDTFEVDSSGMFDGFIRAWIPEGVPHPGGGWPKTGWTWKPEGIAP